MSGGALNMTIEKVREDNLFEKLHKERKSQTSGPGQPGRDKEEVINPVIRVVGTVHSIRTRQQFPQKERSKPTLTYFCF
jgi:hypothetical protein